MTTNTLAGPVQIALETPGITNYSQMTWTKSSGQVNVQASIRGFDEALPSSLVGRFTTTKGGVPSTWGDAVMNRIGNQSAGYGTANPFGSRVTGWSGN